MNLSKNEKISLFLIIIVSVILRLVAGYTLGLEIDEGYYTTYAMDPALSHFDHPPIVGFLIQLTTLNFSIISELAARLGFIICGTVSLIFIYLIGRKVKSPRAGLFAVCMAVANIYFSVYASLIIIPDCPLMMFLLVSFYFFLNFIPYEPKDTKTTDMFFAFLFLGLAFYSKYFAGFLAFGVLLYIIFCNRKWFTDIRIYIVSVLPLFFIGLIFLWNYNNDFISFAFHGTRFNENHIRFDLFFTEIGTEFGLFNPINMFILLAALFLYYKRRFLKTEYFKLILFCSVPLILIVWYTSFYNRTFPQWDGMSYVFLFLIGAAFLDDILKSIKWPVIYAFLALFIMGIAIPIVHEGYFITKPFIPESPDSPLTRPVFNPPKPEKWMTELGHKDPTLVMYGWTKANTFFKEFLREHPKYKDYPLVTMKYFPGGQIDFYIALPDKINLVACGPLKNIRGLYFVNKTRKKLLKGQNALYVALSHVYDDPYFYFKTGYKYFKDVKLLYRTPIYRRGQIVEFMFIYELIDFTGKQEEPHPILHK